MECPICYDKISATEQITQSCCDQTFHIDCLLTWFLSQKNTVNSCPYCRSNCDFNIDKFKDLIYSKPITRSKYKLFEKIYCKKVKYFLNKCEVQRVKEEKTKTMINIMETVFENPLVLIKKPIFNNVVKAKIEELKVENYKNREVLNKDTYYRATEILSNVNEVYNTYLSNFK